MEMRAAEFAGRSFEHALVQCALFHVVPKTLARQLVERDCALVRDRGAETIAIQHLETVHFPTPPFLHIAQEPNWQACQTKIEIYQIGSAFTVNIASFYHDAPVPPLLFPGRIDL